MPPADQGPPAALETKPETKALGNLSFIRKEMTQTMEEVARIADRGASILLLSLGATMLIFAFLFKLRPFGVQVAELSSSEFISALLVAMILLLAGAGIRVYQFLKKEEAGKLVRESGVSLLSKTIDVSADLAKDRHDPNKPI